MSNLLAGPDMAIAPGTMPRASKRGTAMQRMSSANSRSSKAQRSARMLASSARNTAGSVMVLDATLGMPTAMTSSANRASP